MKKYLKSALKGVKYAGLVVASGALVGVGDVVPNLVVDVLSKVGVPEVVAGFAAMYGTPALAGVVAVALEQVRKHRDEIFAPKEGV